jgi:protein SCO1/2
MQHGAAAPWAVSECVAFAGTGLMGDCVSHSSQSRIALRVLRAGRLLLALALLCLPGVAYAAPVAAPPDRTESAPQRLEGIALTERLNAQLPKGLAFTDSSGKTVLLEELVGKGRPTLLTFNYSNCPMLCSLQLGGLSKGLGKLAWVAGGGEFDIVTLSLDPKETTETARRTKERYVREVGKPETARGWSFLVGSEANVRAVADAVGFHYAYNEQRGEYVHAAVVTVLSPTATVARYLYGLEYDARTLRLAIAEASAGKVGGFTERLLLFCFHYDATEGRYAPVARNIMKLGGGVAVLALGALLAVLWSAELRTRRRQKALGTT